MISKDLLLRAPEPTDVDLILKWENNVELWHLGNTLAPFSRFAIEQFVMNTDTDIFSAKQLRLMIDWHTNTTGNITIGSIDLFDFDPHHQRAGIGILIDEPFRKKGFAIQALQLLIIYCFETLSMHQLYCNIDETNKESIALFQKAGFVNCAVKKEWLFMQNKWSNELMFQLINEK